MVVIGLVPVEIVLKEMGIPGATEIVNGTGIGILVNQYHNLVRNMTEFTKDTSR